MRKGIHARDHLVARLAQEELERLENRSLNTLIAKPFEALPQAGFEPPQASVVRREDVIGAANTLDRSHGTVAGNSHAMSKCTGTALAAPSVGVVLATR